MTEPNVVPIRPAAEPPDVLSLVEGVRAVADLVADGVLPQTFDDLARELERVRTIRSRFGDYERRLEAAMEECAPGKLTVVEGLGPVTRRRGKDRKAWRHDEIGYALLRRTREENIDFSTGEIQMRPDEALLKTLLSSAGISYWKVTELKGRGIDPDEFCHSEPGRTTFVIG